jgi:hypothetical protein
VKDRGKAAAHLNRAKNYLLRGNSSIDCSNSHSQTFLLNLSDEIVNLSTKILFSMELVDQDIQCILSICEEMNKNIKYNGSRIVSGKTVSSLMLTKGQQFVFKASATQNLLTFILSLDHLYAFGRIRSTPFVDPTMEFPILLQLFR